MKRARRFWYAGTCQDCGWHRRVTMVTFWATGLMYTVCADCLRPYRKMINRVA